jgi:predicted nucleotide-binding protein with TIR-like domain/nucleotide-binding STING sensor domain-containing protein
MSRSPRRRNIFIVSSTEALPIAQAVKQHFDQDWDVDIWKENIFKLNRGYLETLLNRASYYDYCIAIFAADDEARIREEPVKVTRDNVIFEFGLFLGRIGPNRTFLIVDEDVKLLSDWDGIEVAKYRGCSDLVSAVRTACERIREEIDVAENLPHFTMLPSTSLAIGYCNNFLERVFEAFRFSEKYSIVERNDRGDIISETSHQIVDRRPQIHVLLPRQLQDLEPAQLQQRTSAYRQIAVTTLYREFPFYIGGNPAPDAREVRLFDIPTTLLSSKIAIERIFTAEFRALKEVVDHLGSREIANFERTLQLMMPDKIKQEHLKLSVLE